MGRRDAADSLPRRIVVGNRELRFVARSFGVRWLDVTIVWHPAWPILHPLFEADQLAGAVASPDGGRL